MKSLFHFLLRFFFRFRACNTAALKTPGPVLLIPNHASWIDWLFLLVCMDDDWRFVTSSTTAQASWLHRALMINRHTFPVDPASPYAVKRMAEYLQGGGKLVLFAEGRLSRTGTLMKLFDGTGFLIFKTRAKIITCYLRGASRVPFSPHPGWKRLFTPVSAHFSDALTPPKLEHIGTTQARAQLTGWLRDLMVNQQFEMEMQFGATNLFEAVVHAAQHRPGHIALEDATLQELTYRKLLVGVEVMAGKLSSLVEMSEAAFPSPQPSPQGRGSVESRASNQEAARPIAALKTIHPLPAGEGRGEGERRNEAQGEHSQLGAQTGARIGVLLPNVNATPVVLLALWKLGKVPAVLNFSTGTPTMLTCAQLAGLKHIITSRTFLERVKLKAEPFEQAGLKMIYLEDVKAGITAFDKLGAMVRGTFNIQHSTSNAQSSDSSAVILFTSGSEGVPKGVELSHKNILANIRQMLAITDLTDHDRLFNCLPLFHSFGLTVGLLLPLVRGMYCFIYPSPLHYRVIPAALYDRDCTVFISTNTFLNGYARKAHPYDFRSMRYLFAAAEKLQESTAQTWAQKFGVRILEGYGATECAPCVSVNTPLQPRYGSVGRLLPGMEYRLEPVEGVSEVGQASSLSATASASLTTQLDRQDACPTTGRLFVRGPNVMKGYLNADANAKFQALGGWYDTGDIVSVDADGYLHIRGRMKRFAKVSGEMVSLTAVEDALAGAFPHYGLRCQVAVVTRLCEDKGEALIAVTNEPKLTLTEIRDAIKAKGLTNLCVPREIKAVKEIPKLGTGKVNHRELQAMMARTS